MKNFIFDLYGTLIDIHTDEQSAKFRRRFESYYKKINPKRSFFGEYYALCEGLSEGGGDNAEIDLSAVFSALAGDGADGAARRFRQLSASYIRLYGGVRAFLKRLKGTGAGLYILSNAQSCFTLYELETLKIAKYFDGIELSSDFGRKKPDVSFFEHMLEKYSLEREESIYVGNDICADLHGAKAARLPSAYICSNLSPQGDTLSEAEKCAVFACDTHKRLFGYLLSIRDKKIPLPRN